MMEVMEYFEVENICRSLKDVVNTCLIPIHNRKCPHPENIPIKRKTKDVKSGDIILPWFIKIDKDTDQATKLLHSVQETLSGKCIFVKTVSQDKHNMLSFHLDRPMVIRNIIKEVCEKGSNFGYCDTGQGCTVTLHPFVDKYDGGDVMESPMEMRMFHVMIHLKKVLQACGYQVQTMKEMQKDQDPQKNNCAASQCNVFKDFIASTKTLFQEHKVGGDDNDGIVNLRSIMSKEDFYIGKDGFDKNLEKVEVFTPDGKVTDIVRDVVVFDDSLDIHHPLHIVHAVPHSKVFRLQQMMVLHRALTQKKIDQSLLTIGPVMCKGDVTMEQFHRSRYVQMKEASEMRHGVKCEGPEWDSKIHHLSQAGIKMEVLGTALHCPLKMDLHSGYSAENRLGAFVMYNSARLATLWRQFSQEVKKGTYPPLPTVDDVNFSLLREQEEWELVYLHVASFPSTVMECVEVVCPEQDRLTAKIHMHKITNFLISFSKCLSSYYSRYHILGGPEAHLLPLMYARLHLVRACHQVMTNALQLLDIQPVDQL